jgi:hypothetical protein
MPRPRRTRMSCFHAARGSSPAMTGATAHTLSTGTRRLLRFIYNGLFVRGSPGFPSSSIRRHLIFTSLEGVSAPLRTSPVCICERSRVRPRPLIHMPARSFTPPADNAPSSVLPLEPSSLRHTIAIHLIRIGATSLITITATCPTSLDPSLAGRRRSHRRCCCFA